jgi:exopolysaccharide production protein ExoQ
MPPPLALFLTLVFSAYMLRQDARRAPASSYALWLPVIWVFLIGSRFLSQWLSLIGIPIGGATSLEDGSTFDAVVFLALIAAGIFVLSSRKISAQVFVSQNVWLTVFLVYCFLSIVWSDFPLVAFKRWIKSLGHPVMALIVLTEPNREEALRRVLKRGAYLLLPLSILFIKYYPEFGRYFDSWTGMPSNRGVALSKNELGSLCLVFGLFFFWSLLTVRRLADRQARRQEIGISLFCLWMTWWLLSSADSATSFACMVIGAAVISLLGAPFVSKRYFGTLVMIGIVVFGLAQFAYGIYETTLGLLGRDSTLTSRTEMWADLVAIPINPLLGAGFESFWLGSRLAAIWAIWDFGPNQAHNGYLETYLNLGWIGIVLLLGLLVATFRKSQADMLRDFDFGRLRLGLLFTLLAYNYTESAFKGLHLVWTMFFLISIDYVTQKGREQARVPARDGIRRLPTNARPGHAVAQKPAIPGLAGATPGRQWGGPARAFARRPVKVRESR